MTLRMCVSTRAFNKVKSIKKEIINNKKKFGLKSDVRVTDAYVIDLIIKKW